mgnify:CR=1 FL=1
MRRVIPLLCILLLLCGCGGGQSVSAPDEAARLVIFTARSAAASDPGGSRPWGEGAKRPTYMKQ